MKNFPKQLCRVAIIGYGYWGPNLVRNFNMLEAAQVAAVCDLQEKRLTEVKSKYPAISVTSDYDSILRDTSIEAVIIATPLSTHFPLARKALLAGKHVWVEKPFTETTLQAKTLIQIARRKRVILHVDHIFIYTEAVAYMKQMIVSGKLGELYYFDSTRINLGLFQPDTNVIWDLATHDMAILYYLLEKIPDRVSATGSSHVVSNLEDTAHINFRIGDASAHIHVSWLSPVKLRRTIVAGSKRMIVYDDLETSEKIKVYDYGVSKNKGFLAKSTDAYQYRTGDIFSPALKTKETLQSACARFIDSIRSLKKTPTSGQDGLQVVKMLEASMRSLKLNGRFVTL